MVRHQLHGRPSVYTYCDASCVVIKLPGTRGPGGPAFFGFCFASPDFCCSYNYLSHSIDRSRLSGAYPLAVARDGTRVSAVTSTNQRAYTF